MANTTLLQNNYRKISDILTKLDKDEATTDDVLSTYRTLTKEIPDTYNKTGKPNPIKPLGLAVANKNLTYAIKHQEDVAFKIDVKDFRKKLTENNGKNHWLLYNYKNHHLFNPTKQNVKTLVSNYQQGLNHDLEANLNKQKQKSDELDL